MIVEIACLYTSCECPSRRSSTQKLSNQVTTPCSFSPLTRKIVSGVLFLRTWFRKVSWRFCERSAAIVVDPFLARGPLPAGFICQIPVPLFFSLGLPGLGPCHYRAAGDAVQAEVGTGAPNPTFADQVLRVRLRTSGSKGHWNHGVASVP